MFTVFFYFLYNVNATYASFYEVGIDDVADSVVDSLLYLKSCPTCFVSSIESFSSVGVDEKGSGNPRGLSLVR